MIVGIINSPLAMLTHRNVLLVWVSVAVCPVLERFSLSQGVHFPDVVIIVIDIS